MTTTIEPPGKGNSGTASHDKAPEVTTTRTVEIKVLVILLLGAVVLAVGVTVALTSSQDGPASPPPLSEFIIVPAVTGMTVRDADSVLRSAGVEAIYSPGAMRIDASANATVSSQSVAPGTSVRRTGSGVTVGTRTAIASHQNHSDVDFDAPMVGAYDSTFKVVYRRLWAGQDPATVQNFCSQTPNILISVARYTQANDVQVACADAFEMWQFVRAYR